MEKLTINVKDVLLINDKEYRVLGFNDSVVSLCEMNRNKLKIILITQNEILERLDSFEIKIQEQKEYKVFNIDELSEISKSEFLLRKEIVNKVINLYGPLFEPLSKKTYKPELEQTFKDYPQLAENTIRRFIRKFLQSGFDEYSLLDKRSELKGKRAVSETVKYGRKSNSEFGSDLPRTKEMMSNFDEAIKDCMSGRHRTKKASFNNMLAKHYSETIITDTGISRILLPPSQRPSERQFLYYFRQNVSKQQYDEAKTSVREVRNNQRVLLSDCLKNVTGPGYLFQVDETEVDISLVSNDNPNITVGRPILYVMRDVYSEMIVAFSVAFENNSVIGLTNCFINLLDDKKELCKRYGIEITDDEWPSKIKPVKIRSDYGSEYISRELDRIINELDISKDLVSPAMGSLKGLIEQLFHQINSCLNPVTENYGLIEKRHDSNHHKEATLNIEEFKKMLIATIVVKNHEYLKDYPITKDMRRKGIKPTPVELWKYGVSIAGNARPIGNEELFRYSLLTPVHASYSRAGVKFKGLYYINYSDKNLMAKIYRAGSNWLKFETARIDPRDIGKLYYLKNGKVNYLSLNQNKTGMAEWNGISLYDYQAYLKDKRNNDAAGNEMNTKLEVALQQHNKQVLTSSNGYDSKPIAKNLSHNRAVEKRKDRIKNTVFKESGDQIPEVVESPNENEEFYVPKDALEALERFEEGKWKD